MRLILSDEFQESTLGGEHDSPVILRFEVWALHELQSKLLRMDNMGE